MTNIEIQQSVEKFRTLRAELGKELDKVKRGVNPYGPDFSQDVERKFRDLDLNLFNSILEIEDFLIDSKK